MIYSVYGRWQHGTPLLPETVEEISKSFRPDDDTVCIWVDSKEAGVLRLSVDIDAISDDEALAMGQAALSEAVAATSLPGRPIEGVVPRRSDAELLAAAEHRADPVRRHAAAGEVVRPLRVPGSRAAALPDLARSGPCPIWPGHSEVTLIVRISVVGRPRLGERGCCVWRDVRAARA